MSVRELAEINGAEVISVLITNGTEREVVEYYTHINSGGDVRFFLFDFPRTQEEEARIDAVKEALIGLAKSEGRGCIDYREQLSITDAFFTEEQMRAPGMKSIRVPNLADEGGVIEIVFGKPEE